MEETKNSEKKKYGEETTWKTENCRLVSVGGG